LLVRLDQLEADIARLEREIASARHERISVSSEPAPASATAAEAEVSER
jgi:hypothetical protein